MSRASNIDPGKGRFEHQIKHLPGFQVELTTTEVSIARVNSNEIKQQKVIVGAKLRSGEEWHGTEPVKIHNWVATE